MDEQNAYPSWLDPTYNFDPSFPNLLDPNPSTQASPLPPQPAPPPQPGPSSQPEPSSSPIQLKPLSPPAIYVAPALENMSPGNEIIYHISFHRTNVHAKMEESNTLLFGGEPACAIRGHKDSYVAFDNVRRNIARENGWIPLPMLLTDYGNGLVAQEVRFFIKAIRDGAALDVHVGTLRLTPAREMSVQEAVDKIRVMRWDRGGDLGG